jgi:hypothetical protein
VRASLTLTCMPAVVGPPALRFCRRGTSSVEVLVAFTLLASVLGLATPLVVKQQRLLAAQRDYRLALDELSNQLDRLTVLSQDELAAAVEQLLPSSFITARLSDVRLRGELKSQDPGTCVILRITWDELQRGAAPLAMAAWVYPKPAAAGVPPTRSAAP